jgi:predicted O-linked N-acetylglucosamine transferase (SPINDLY family)
VARQEQADYLRSHGYERAQAIGLPILYTNQTQLARITGSLLVVPTHTLPGANFSDRRPFEQYADAIKAAADRFERVVVCVHPCCANNGLWINEFKERNIELVSGARAMDRHALIRMRALFEQFEYVTTNGWGSHIPYALAFGAKVSIFGPEISSPEDDDKNAKNDITWAANPDAWKALSSSTVMAERRLFLDRLYQDPQNGVYDPAWGEWFLGASHKLSPEEMCKMFPELVDSGLNTGGDIVVKPRPPVFVPGEFQKVMDVVEKLLRSGQIKDAIAQTEVALTQAPSAECEMRAREILELLRSETSVAKTSVNQGGAITEEIFGPDEVQSLEQLATAYSNNPTDTGVSGQMRELQQGVMNFLVTAEFEKLEDHFKGSLGRVFRALIRSGLPSEEPTEVSSGQVGVLDEALAGPSDPKKGFDYRPLLARMLCAPAHRGGMIIAPERIPGWFLDDYLGYVLHAPLVFVMAGEAEEYRAHLLAWSRAIRQLMRTRPGDPLTNKVAQFFAMRASYIPLYFSNSNTRELAENRAAIMEFVLTRNGAVIDTKFPKRPKPRAKIKVGYVSAHFGAQTETHVTLPTLRLDRSKFEICLFAVAINPGPIEDYARSLADSFRLLPKNYQQQVKVLREAALDVVIIGTNVTAVSNAVALIALHRLAPLQLASYCSPVSTGMRHIDGYLTGTLNDYPGLQEHFTEKLHFCEGPPGCLDYTVESPGSGKTFDRASLGLADDDVVFVNAAACFKILPEMQETWAKILAAVPKSRLLLLPFNPSWSNAFPQKQFERTLTEACARHGVGRERFILAGSLPSRADVKALERVADVYLDTSPFSGSISVIDPLELGLPLVVQEGATHRSRMASALLREIGLPELITADEAAYVALAVKLGTEVAYRQKTSAGILEKMAGHPKFINPRAYGQGLSELLESLVTGKPQKSAENAEEKEP